MNNNSSPSCCFIPSVTTHTFTMDVKRLAKETVGTKVQRGAMSVEYPSLLQFDCEFITVFLREHDACWREAFVRALQLTGYATTSLEPVKPVSLFYCVEAEQSESAIECGLIGDYTDVDMLTSEALRRFLDKETEGSKDVMTEANLTATVQASLRMKMSVKSAKGNMKLLFMKYRSLLRTNGIKLVTKEKPKLAIKHVYSAIKPAYLRSRLEQIIAFSYQNLRADFNAFIQHALKVSEAFKLADSGPSTYRKLDQGSEKSKSPHISVGLSSSQAGGETDPFSNGDCKSKNLPPMRCPLLRCEGKNCFN